jgi:hypothetical protein
MAKTQSVVKRFSEILKKAQAFEDEPPTDNDLYVKVGGPMVGGEVEFQLRSGPGGFELLKDGQVVNEHDDQMAATVELLDMVGGLVQGSSEKPGPDAMTQVASVAQKFSKIIG